MKSKATYLALGLISRSLNSIGIKPIQVAYYDMGINKYETNEVSGENYFVQKILGTYISGEKPLLFDVGANIGSYSLYLRKCFPSAQIHSFEPNPNTFKKLSEKVKDLSVKTNNVGLSSVPGKLQLFTPPGDLTSSHASLYNGVFESMHRVSDTIAVDIETITLDNYCLVNNLEIIDFLKIDTEGHELEVLKGAIDKIKNNKINVIQFEFNEMNIESRVFLKDFYDLLENYELFRLDTKTLIPLGKYSSTNEIFKFQNIVAINKTRL